MTSANKKKNEDAQFKEDLELLGVDDSIIDEVMDIHRINPNLVPYECKRLFNIRRNEEKLNKLNLLEIKVVMEPPKRENKKRTLKEKIVFPPRKSARISGMQPVQYNDAPYSYHEITRKKSVTVIPSRKSSRICELKPVQYYYESDD